VGTILAVVVGPILAAKIAVSQVFSKVAFVLMGHPKEKKVLLLLIRRPRYLSLSLMV